MASEVIESVANFLDEYHNALGSFLGTLFLFISFLILLTRQLFFVKKFYQVAVTVKMSVMPERQIVFSIIFINKRKLLINVSVFR